MGAIGQYINVRTTATGEVRQVNLYSSLDDVGGDGKEFAYGGTACWAAVSEDAGHENRSGWAYRAANGATMQVLTHYEDPTPVEFNMFNWAWANYEAATGQNHVTLTAFDNTSALPNARQLAGVTNVANAFVNCQNVTEIPFNVTGGNFTSLAYMFWNCPKLTALPSFAGEGRITDVRYMCNNCRSVQSLEPLAGLDVNGITLLDSTFRNCTSLTSLDGIANWNTNSVTNMSYMFGFCNVLNNVSGISGWNTSKVTGMTYLFANCHNLANASPLSSWNTNAVTNFYGTFINCNRLSNISGLSGWRTNSATTLASMFYNCTNVSNLTPLNGWNTAKVTNMYHVFYNCMNVTDLTPLADWRTNNATLMSQMFFNCRNVTNLSPLANWNAGAVTNAVGMFLNCRNLTCAAVPDTLASSANCTVCNAFRNCVNVQGNIFFRGAYVNNAVNCFNGANAYAKSIIANRSVSGGTYNSFYTAMGNSRTNSAWNATLYPLDPVLTISATPSNATVTVNGKTGATYTGEWGEQVGWTVEASGYISQSGTLTLVEDTELPVTLVASARTITFRVSPTDATVTINGTAYTPNSSGEVTVTANDGDTLSWSVSKEGYVTQSGSLTVDGDTTLSVSLTAQTYTFTINPTPSDATVTINGTETNSVTVAYGTEITWSVEADGYEGRSETLVIYRDTVLDVALSFGYIIPLVDTVEFPAEAGSVGVFGSNYVLLSDILSTNGEYSSAEGTRAIAVGTVGLAMVGEEAPYAVACTVANSTSEDITFTLTLTYTFADGSEKSRTFSCVQKGMGSIVIPMGA